MLALCLLAGAAHAQTRTWVSGVGNDANPCSRTAPCKTFAGAISKTAAGGEINALDPGGFGAVTITKAITIDGGGGQVAGVLVAGTNGIIVNAPAGAIVTLRNIQINGVGSGLDGIHFIAGAGVIVEHCNISGFTKAGINVATTSNLAGLIVHDTYIPHNANGVSLAPSGALANVNAAFVNVQSEGNTGAGFLLAPTGGAHTGVVIDRSNALLNATGITVGANSTLFLGNSKVLGNLTGVSNAGAVNTYLTSEINGNSVADVTGTPFVTTPLR